MAGPPKDIAADELWMRLLERPRPSDVVDFPRRGADGRPIGRIRIRVLTLEEHTRARLAAHKYLVAQVDAGAIAADDMLRDVRGDAVACEVLALACQHEQPMPGSADATPSYPLAFPRGPAELRSRLTADELASLFSAYVAVQRRFGPTEDTVFSDADVSEWIRKLAEGASALPLALLDSFQRLELATLLAARCYYLSAILDSLWPSLPASVRSDLETLGIGAGSVTRPPAISADGSSSPSTESARDGTLTLEEATRLVRAKFFPRSADGAD